MNNHTIKDFMAGLLVFALIVYLGFYTGHIYGRYTAPECPPQRVKLSDPAELLEKSGDVLESLVRANEAAIERNKAAIDRQMMEMEQRR